MTIPVIIRPPITPAAPIPEPIEAFEIALPLEYSIFLLFTGMHVCMIESIDGNIREANINTYVYSSSIFLFLSTVILALKILYEHACI